MSYSELLFDCQQQAQKLGILVADFNRMLYDATATLETWIGDIDAVNANYAVIKRRKECRRFIIGLDGGKELLELEENKS